MKKLVIHVSHTNSAEFNFFVENALFQSDDVTFILVRNNDTATPESFEPIIAKYTNVHVFIRPNVGHDFQGWNEALFLPVEVLSQRIIVNPVLKLTGLYTLYDQFIFANDTAAGPYLPSYITDNWVDCFTARLDDMVKLVGLSINYITTYKIGHQAFDQIERYYGIKPTNLAHIQSMVFAMDSTGLNVLIRKELFKLGKQFPTDKVELVVTSEVAMTPLIFDAGYAVFSFLKHPGQGVVTEEMAEDRVTEHWGDPGYDDHWLSSRIKTTLCETMFVKINRGFDFMERSRYNNFATLNAIELPPTIKPVTSIVWEELPEFGFIILRHVNDAVTDNFWKTAYTKIRLFHDEPIIILDDNSNPAFLTHLDTVNCHVVQSEFPARGEMLPYYYFHKLRPWRKAVFIHDSVFINTRISAEAVNDVKFLWEFHHSLARPAEVPALLSHLKHSDELLQKYNEYKPTWSGCFGGMSVIEWQFLNDIVQKYDIFVLLHYINTRPLRMGWERILGLVCCHAKSELYLKPSIFGQFGNVLSSTDNTYNGYLTEQRNIPMFKVFTGR